MNITFNYQDAIFEINKEIAQIPKTLKSTAKPTIQKIAKIVKRNVEVSLQKIGESEAKSNYDGSTPYIHMKNDVKTSVKDDKEGTVYAIIRGGKYTAYKWHLVNNGTVNTKATHFIDNALKQSETEANALVDEMINKAVQ